MERCLPCTTCSQTCEGTVCSILLGADWLRISSSLTQLLLLVHRLQIDARLVQHPFELEVWWDTISSLVVGVRAINRLKAVDADGIENLLCS